MNELHELYIVCDVETNQIDEKNGGFMLELAALALDENLDEVGDFHTLIDPGVNVQDESLYHPKVWEMHKASGLLEEHELNEGIPTYEQAADLFIQWAWNQPGDDKRKNAEGDIYPRKGVGNNFGEFDLRWLREHMPRTEKIFHYRAINVSSLRETAAAALGVDQRALKEFIGFGNHRAVDDVRACATEYRMYRDMMRNGYGHIANALYSRGLMG